MPFFKSTYNILVKVDQDEVFDPNWMDSDKLILPPKKEWDYSRELQIEDVNIWEVIFEQSGGIGVYASWDPYAEFYLITYGFSKKALKTIDGIPYSDKLFETHYGAGAQKAIQQRMKELKIPFSANEHWVEPENMWLYEEPIPKKIII